ncbi:zinc finger protein 675-like [Physella acuta]|uniref:zinc finger protein 675-like n=1 Tax=Physella acuta TaxID=109671 RepID=UPI0027DADC4F|nr:zinc finger protein 675-like [Physella acuta]
MRRNVQCSMCSRRCCSSKRLIKHFRKRHPEVNILKCCFCEYVTHDDTLFNHHKQYSHPEERFACEFCEFTTRKWNRLKKHHTKRHFAPQVKSLSNYDSGELFNYMSSEISADCSANQVSTISFSGCAFGNSEVKNSVLDKEQNLLAVKVITKGHFGLSENKKLTKVKPDNQVTGPLPQTSRELKCSCEGLKHCKICQQTNPDSQTTTQPSDNQVTGPLPQTSRELKCSCEGLKHCKICQQTNPDKLTQPLAEWFKCEDCQKSFEYSLHLTYHQLVHTPQRCYICGKCDRYFNEAEEYDQHLYRHFLHRPFQCEMCEKAFTRKDSLTLHMRLHTGNLVYKCNLCNYATNLQSVLLAHNRFHSNLKPYKCHTCDYASTCTSSLVKHIRIHSGEKPFCCNLCDKRFSQRTTLQKHRKTIHLV